jgi:hypothetical protein
MTAMLYTLFVYNITTPHSLFRRQFLVSNPVRGSLTSECLCCRETAKESAFVAQDQPTQRSRLIAPRSSCAFTRV